MNLDGLYELLSKNSTEIQIRLASENHAIFKAHFPSNPILPAFIHLEIIAKEFNIIIKEIKKAKLSEIVSPNAIIRYVKENNKFKIIINNKQVAIFSL